MFARFTGLWRHRDFMKLWAGQTVSVFGSLIGGTALPFTAILVLKATPLEMGLLAAAGLAPGFAAGLFAGVWVDRLRRRPILIAADLGRALLLATIPLAAFMHQLHITQLYSVAFLNSILTIFFDVAYQSYLPTLVGREEVIAGNSKLSASASVAEFSGFGIAGWLIQIFTAPIAVLIDAISFLVSATTVGLIRTPEARTVAREERQGMWHEIMAGLRELLQSPILRALASCTLIKQLGGGMIGAVILLYTNRELGFSPGILGMIFGVGGISAFFGAVIAPYVTRKLGIGRASSYSLLAASCLGFLIPLAHGATLLAALLLIVPQLLGDGCYTIYDINTLSLRQVLAPERLLGRVNASMQFISQGGLLAGSLLGGVLGSLVGLRATLVLAFCTGLVGAVWLLLSPVRGASIPAEMLASSVPATLQS
ncbi:MAG: MFS transporter [Herpetosiphonaceae bacterium]|nr:MFS transporter [Herpetosiphonaceae bacterium]